MSSSTRRLLMRRDGESQWRSPSTTAYSDESALQELLERSPELLQEDGLSRPLAIARELYLPGTGPVDIVAVGGDGEIIVVECKLKANPEIRRHVVGQLFAYASALWRMPYEDFDRAFSDRAGASLTERLSELLSDSEGAFDPEGFRSLLAARLDSGRFSLVLAIDEITDELKRIIEYLNSLTLADVTLIALELRYLADGEMQILIPRTYGKEIARAKSATPRAQAHYDWDAFAAMRIPPERIAVATALAAAVEAAVRERGRPWELVFRKGYLALLRPGGYKVAVIDVLWKAVPRLAVKLPARPSELGIPDPYSDHGLSTSWDQVEHEWGWTIPTVEQIPEVGLALDLAAPYQPDRGPMGLIGTLTPNDSDDSIAQSD